MKGKNSFANVVRSSTGKSSKASQNPPLRVSAFAQLRFLDNYMEKSASKPAASLSKFHTKKCVLRWQLKRVTTGANAVKTAGALKSKTAAPSTPGCQESNFELDVWPQPMVHPGTKTGPALFPCNPAHSAPSSSPQAHSQRATAPVSSWKLAAIPTRCSICFNYGQWGRILSPQIPPHATLSAHSLCGRSRGVSGDYK